MPYRFYPLLAILLVFAIAFSGRDFGPMRAAERRATQTGRLASADSSIDPEKIDDELQVKPDVPYRLSNAVVPIVVLVGVAMASLFVTGEGDSLRDIIGSADAYGALMYGSLLGVLVAAAMSMAQRLLGLGEVVDAWFAGVRSVLFVLIILTLAWALSAITGRSTPRGISPAPWVRPCHRSACPPCCSSWRPSRRSPRAPVGGRWAS